MKKRLVPIVTILILVAVFVFAQTTPIGGVAPVPVTTYTPYVITALTATAAVGSPATLTIPAPPSGQYNYVCYLALEGSVDATGGATIATNSTTSNANFGTFSMKISNPATVNTDTGILTAINAIPPGCPKSVSPTTSTTFTSPTTTHLAYNWYATYFQAP